jgi:hypothetical protein
LTSAQVRRSCWGCLHQPRPSAAPPRGAVFNLKFTAKQLARASVKCEKEEKSEKLKVKKAIEKGNMEGAKIYVRPR